MTETVEIRFVVKPRLSESIPVVWEKLVPTQIGDGVCHELWRERSIPRNAGLPLTKGVALDGGLRKGWKRARTGTQRS